MPYTKTQLKAIKEIAGWNLPDRPGLNGQMTIQQCDLLPDGGVQVMNSYMGVILPEPVKDMQAVENCSINLIDLFLKDLFSTNAVACPVYNPFDFDAPITVKRNAISKKKTVNENNTPVVRILADDIDGVYDARLLRLMLNAMGKNCNWYLGYVEDKPLFTAKNPLLFAARWDNGFTAPYGMVLPVRQL